METNTTTKARTFADMDREFMRSYINGVRSFDAAVTNTKKRGLNAHKGAEHTAAAALDTAISEDVELLAAVAAVKTYTKQLKTLDECIRTMCADWRKLAKYMIPVLVRVAKGTPSFFLPAAWRPSIIGVMIREHLLNTNVDSNMPKGTRTTVDGKGKNAVPVTLPSIKAYKAEMVDKVLKDAEGNEYLIKVKTGNIEEYDKVLKDYTPETLVRWLVSVIVARAKAEENAAIAAHNAAVEQLTEDWKTKACKNYTSTRNTFVKVAKEDLEQNGQFVEDKEALLEHFNGLTTDAANRARKNAAKRAKNHNDAAVKAFREIGEDAPEIVIMPEAF